VPLRSKESIEFQRVYAKSKPGDTSTNSLAVGYNSTKKGRSTVRHFADRAITRIRQLGHPLCVGLDPHLDLLPKLFRRGTMGPKDPQTAEAVEAFLLAVLAVVGQRVAVVKPQIAFFERLGWRGLRVLERVATAARQQGLLVLLDAKRGDIGSTASAYAQAYLGDSAPLAVDAITLNPYLGLDTLAPFVKKARKEGCGLFVLVKTSNPGAGDFQDRPLVSGHSLCDTVARALAETTASLTGPSTSWSSLGVVVGATWPGEAERIRGLLPKALFLVPGYGAQGGSAAQAVRGFVSDGSGRLEGGLVNSSRGILFPPGTAEAGAERWEQLIDKGLGQAVEDLGTAVTLG
jgi:orotidine-5'-phosphate decarboxylase